MAAGTRIIVGVLGMHEQPVRRSFVQGRGYSWTRRWIGPKNSAYGLEQQLIAQNYDVSVIEDGPNATVEANFSGRDDSGGVDEVPEDLWEQSFNIVEKEFYQADDVAALAQIEVDDEDLLSQLRRAVDERTLRNVSPDVDPVTYANFYEAYNLALAGTQSITVEQIVIRRTRTVSARFNRTLEMANVGKIISYDDMIEGEGAPAELVATGESNASLAFTNIFGYRKTTPSITQTAGNKWHIVNEYVSGVWATLLYEEASY